MADTETIMHDDLTTETPPKRPKDATDRATSEVITLWTWRGLLMLGVTAIGLAAILASWKVAVAPQVFWTGVSLAGIGLALALIRDWVFKHK